MVKEEKGIWMLQNLLQDLGINVVFKDAFYSMYLNIYMYLDIYIYSSEANYIHIYVSMYIVLK